MCRDIVARAPLHKLVYELTTCLAVAASGASIAASPLIALSLLAPEYQQSFAALLIGFALSETWRAPAAVLVREVSPPELGATGSALHLCIRNLVGGCGPLSKLLPLSHTPSTLSFCFPSILPVC